MAVIKVDDTLKNKIEYMAKENNKTLKKMTDEIINFYFDSQENEVNNTIQLLINNRFTKMENHLASMLGRNNIDTAMTLVSHFMLVEKITKGKITFDDIQKVSREHAIKYLKLARAEDRKKDNS